MPENQDKNRGDLTYASNESNILCPTTLDQLLEVLHKEVEAANAANVAHAIAACSFKTRSSKVADLDKLVNFRIATLCGTSTSAPKVLSWLKATRSRRHAASQEKQRGADPELSPGLRQTLDRMVVTEGVPVNLTL